MTWRVPYYALMLGIWIAAVFTIPGDNKIAARLAAWIICMIAVEGYMALKEWYLSND